MPEYLHRQNLILKSKKYYMGKDTEFKKPPNGGL